MPQPCIAKAKQAPAAMAIAQAHKVRPSPRIKRRGKCME